MSIRTRDTLVPSETLEKWQKVVDIMAAVLDVPSAIITRVDPPEIEVLTASNSPGNPYRGGLTVTMAGHYCQGVVEKNRRLEVHNAPEDPEWNNAPEIKYGIVAYLGYPLLWPGGEMFGTICILDSRKNTFGSLHDRVLQQFRELVETHLELVDRVELLERTVEELKEKQRVLNDALSAKDFLMREMNHRVKNSLSLIVSLTNLERSRIVDESADALLADLGRRIGTIGMVHERLYKSPDQVSINVSVFLDDIVTRLAESFGAHSSRPEIRLNIDNANLPAARIIPLGLIVTELFTNSMKYAACDRPAIIRLDVRKSGEEWGLEFADNGPGLPEGLEPEATETLGLKLVSMLVQQINGTLSYGNRGGAWFAIRFPDQEIV